MLTRSDLQWVWRLLSIKKWNNTPPLKIYCWKMRRPFKMVPFQGTCEFLWWYIPCRSKYYSLNGFLRKNGFALARVYFINNSRDDRFDLLTSGNLPLAQQQTDDWFSWLQPSLFLVLVFMIHCFARFFERSCSKRIPSSLCSKRIRSHLSKKTATKWKQHPSWAVNLDPWARKNLEHLGESPFVSTNKTPSWWFQRIWKIVVKLDHFPK